MVIALCTNILGMILAIAGSLEHQLDLNSGPSCMERSTGCVNVYLPPLDYDCHCQHNNETIKCIYIKAKFRNSEG